MEKQSSDRSLLHRAYNLLCVGELYLAAALFMLIVVLVFLSALTRKIGIPIQWTMDVTKLCFAWLAFLSGDIALRSGVLPGIDMLVLKLRPTLRVILGYVVKICMFLLLVFFVYYGFKLASSNVKRTFQTLPISYSLVTMSLPVCSVLMMFSMISNTVDDLKKKTHR
ncbi:MAG: TRAP transporter small permease [Sphaerochaeta sp.]|jgi:TRAP-type C4-dicarboxylate transport system permease small subunit|uniref:TRAP transporter small permease n=1 Tax=Sphaerochaeta sp. TaxID=1972642 RepID=UPI003D11AABE